MISYWLLILPHRLSDWTMFHYYCHHHGLPGSVHLLAVYVAGLTLTCLSPSGRHINNLTVRLTPLTSYTDRHQHWYLTIIEATKHFRLLISCRS